jgi:hypothetical protein
MYSGKATSDALWDWNMIMDENDCWRRLLQSSFGHQFENDILTSGQECQNFVHPEDRFASTESYNRTDVYRWTEECYLKSMALMPCKDKAIIRNDEGKALMIEPCKISRKEKKLKDESRQRKNNLKEL